jgi:hypothetical protein
VQSVRKKLITLRASQSNKFSLACALNEPIWTVVFQVGQLFSSATYATAFFSLENKDACLLLSWVLKLLMPVDTINEVRQLK